MERPSLPARAVAPLVRVLAGAAFAAFAATVGAQGVGSVPATAVVETEHVRAELVVHAPQGVAPGKPLRLGLKMAHAPKWHTYWKNAGDSGLPTQLAWSLPAGFSAGEIRWPVPEAIPVGPLVNYGYEDEILLAVDVAVPPGFTGSTLDVRLKAEWLVCREICIPEDGAFALAVPVGGATAGASRAFAAADARLPKAAPGAAASATVEGDGAALVVVADGLPAAARGRALAFFAETPNTIEHAAQVTQSWQGDRWTVRVPLSPQRSESPTTMPALLVDPSSGSGWPVAVAVRGWPAGSSGAGATSAPGSIAGPDAATATAAAGALGAATGPAAAAPSAAAATTEVGTIATPALLATLGLALLGGLLLNLMPCVFPVLSIKVLSYAAMPQGRRLRAAGGAAYTAGVVLSFLALGGALLALRAGGEQLGWGFQLQSPVVVAGLAVLFALLGLNLVGVFEFGNVLPSRVACTTLRHPLADDFLTGVLAVAIASPCTAPFMGAATGATLALPAIESMAVFGAVGLGMALPFLLASVLPQVARVLPKPGPWLGRFRTLMAFPMFATVVWLSWVLGRQVGIDGVAVLLALLVAVAFAAWALGGRGFGRRSRLGFGAVGAALVAGVVAMGWPMLLYPDPGSGAMAAAANASTTTARWRAWSPEALQTAQREGRTVFVDFTAAWCITCQVNKRTTLADDGVLDDFRARDIALLRADWTLRDARITAELAKLGRSGVPVYAVYPADGSAPRILPELLTAGIVRSALAALPAPRAVPAAAPPSPGPAARPSVLPASLQTSTPDATPAAEGLAGRSAAVSILMRSTPMTGIPVLRRRTALVAGALAALAVAGTALAQTPAVATVGQSAPAFSAKDTAGRTVSLADQKGKWVVLEWTNPECPYVQKHYDSGNMPATMKRAIAGGAVWLGVSTGDHTAGSGAQLASWLKAKDAAPTALLLDGDGRIARAYAAKTTPHMYVIDPQGKLVYAGAIDSRPTASKADIAGATNHVDAALADAKAGRPIATAQTRAYGCTVKYPSAIAG